MFKEINDVEKINEIINKLYFVYGVDKIKPPYIKAL